MIGVVADAGGAMRPHDRGARPAARRARRGQGRPRDRARRHGRNAAELEATLGTLAERATWPLVALPGDLEPSRPRRSRPLHALRKRGDAVLDGAAGALRSSSPAPRSARCRVRARASGSPPAPTAVRGRRRRRAAVHRAHGASRACASWRRAEAPRAIVDGEPTGELALVRAPAADRARAPRPDRAGPVARRAAAAATARGRP